MTTFFTADLHLGHFNLIAYHRPQFSTIEEMDSEILQNINLMVGRNDELYILGDFTMSHNVSFIQKYRDKINCHNIYLVLGNHDSRSIESYKTIFKNAYAQRVIKVQGQKIHLNHYAMRAWESSHNGSWHLYGHSHGMLPAIGRSFDVGIDTNDMMPYSFDDLYCRLMLEPKTPYRVENP